MKREDIVNSLQYQAAAKAIEYWNNYLDDKDQDKFDPDGGDIVEAYEDGAEFGFNFAIDMMLKYLNSL